MSDGQKVT